MFCENGGCLICMQWLVSKEHVLKYCHVSGQMYVSLILTIGPREITKTILHCTTYATLQTNWRCYNVFNSLLQIGAKMTSEYMCSKSLYLLTTIAPYDIFPPVGKMSFRHFQIFQYLKTKLLSINTCKHFFKYLHVTQNYIYLKLEVCQHNIISSLFKNTCRQEVPYTWNVYKTILIWQHIHMDEHLSKSDKWICVSITALFTYTCH